MIKQYVSKLTSRVLLAFVVWSVFFVVPSFAQSGRRLAMVVAVSEFDFDRSKNLPFVDVDAMATINRLKSLGFTVDVYCDKSLGLKGSKSPTYENVLGGLKTFSSKVGPNDVVFIYVSSHGDALGDKTYLVMKDTKVKDEHVVPETALAASDLRKAVNNLRTKKVFLALDTCCSGGTRGSRSAGYRDVLRRLNLEDGSDVATLASCMVAQKSSIISKDKDVLYMSYFTYWLLEGLKGHADENGDDEITTLELSNYVLHHAKSDTQTPCVVASPDSEPFAFANVKAFSSLTAIDDVAEQIATRLFSVVKKRKQDQKQVAPELSLVFDVDAKLLQFDSERKRDAASTFRNLFSEKLERSVKQKLEDVSIKINFESKSVSKGDVPKFHCEIGAPKDSDSRYFQLSGSLSGLKDANGSNSECKIVSKIAYDEQVGAQLGEVNEEDELVGSADVWIEVEKNGRYEKRYPEEIDGALWVPLDVGEKYRIAYNLKRVSEHGVGVRALIDGRSFLAQYESYVTPKFCPVDSAPEDDAIAGTEIVERPEPVEVERPIASLGEARFWVISNVGRHTISGFYTRTAAEDKESNAILEPFEVASNDEENAEQNDAVGSILVAFYRLVRTRAIPHDMRTVPTEESPTTLIRVDGVEIAKGQEPFACFSLRYASSEALERFKQDPEAFYKGVEDTTEEFEFH